MHVLFSDDAANQDALEPSARSVKDAVILSVIVSIDPNALPSIPRRDKVEQRELRHIPWYNDNANFPALSAGRTSTDNPNVNDIGLSDVVKYLPREGENAVPLTTVTMNMRP